MLRALPSMSFALALALPGYAFAQSPPAGAPKPMTREQRVEMQKQAWRAGFAAAKQGTVQLDNQGAIALKDGIVLIPQPQAGNLMRAMGNTVRPDFIALITAKDTSQRWVATVSFKKEGYVKDDDAKNWNADDLFKSLKAGTEKANEYRRSRGFPGLIVNGWIEKPVYDETTQRLIWSLSASSEGAAPNAPQTVNYNTYKLGREGYFSLNMLTNSVDVARDKEIAKTLLGSLTFDAGKDYADFKEGTDNVATYGLAALVGGAALKKAGFLALILAFLAKSGKLIGLVVIGGGVLLAKVFGRKKQPDA